MATKLEHEYVKLPSVYKDDVDYEPIVSNFKKVSLSTIGSFESDFMYEIQIHCLQNNVQLH